MEKKRESVVFSMRLDLDTMKRIDSWIKEAEKVGPKISKAPFMRNLLKTGLQRLEERSR